MQGLQKNSRCFTASHNAGFCRDCFLKFFTRQVERAIHGEKLFTHEDRILVALSGGKDSLALMLELSRQGYDVTGLHIDLAIPGSSAAARRVVERFCAKHELPLIIKDMQAEGLPIPKVKKTAQTAGMFGMRKNKTLFFQ